jgi:hypothetical protein
VIGDAAHERRKARARAMSHGALEYGPPVRADIRIAETAGTAGRVQQSPKPQRRPRPRLETRSRRSAAPVRLTGPYERIVVGLDARGRPPAPGMREIIALVPADRPPREFERRFRGHSMRRLSFDSIKWARSRQREVTDPLDYAKFIRRKMLRSSIEGKYSKKTLEQLTEEEKTYVINGVPRFPIADKEDLKAAIPQLGEVDLPLRPSVKSYITRRAVEMRLTFMLPDSWDY